jgi:hypothetical protein
MVRLTTAGSGRRKEVLSLSAMAGFLVSFFRTLRAAPVSG